MNHSKGAFRCSILERKTTQNGLSFVTRCGIKFRGKDFDSKLSASGAPDRQSCSIVSLRSKAIGELLYIYLGNRLSPVRSTILHEQLHLSHLKLSCPRPKALSRQFASLSPKQSRSGSTSPIPSPRHASSLKKLQRAEQNLWPFPSAGFQAILRGSGEQCL